MTCTAERAAQLKAEAIAARRASRAPWQNAHADRITREREAQATSRDYRRAQREAEKSASIKQCATCGDTKPTDAFEVLRTGNLRATCEDCRAAAASDRRLQARIIAREKKAVEEQARQAAEIARRRERAERKRSPRKRPLSPERQREIAERIPHLTSLLMGTNRRERIDDQQSWEAAASELHNLWAVSGDKECAFCKAVVPPSAMLPPGPANFYPGRCRNCSLTEYRQHQLKVFGKMTEGPPTILMRDGSRITVAEFSRRAHLAERSTGVRTSGE